MWVEKRFLNPSALKYRVEIHTHHLFLRLNKPEQAKISTFEACPKLQQGELGRLFNLADLKRKLIANFVGI
jgi:hypothetical protein